MEKKKGLVISAIIILVIGLGVLAYLLLRTQQENKEMAQLFEIEKEEMENEYTHFANQYDELQIQINNDSLFEKLESEKLKTQRLLEELRQVKSTNAAEITRLKKELNTVRAVMRSYILQIDSLNRINEALTTENKQVKQRYTEATRQISNLAKKRRPERRKYTGGPTGCHQYTCYAKEQTRQNDQQGKEYHQAGYRFHHCEKHYSHYRRTYLIYTYHQTG